MLLQRFDLMLEMGIHHLGCGFPVKGVNTGQGVVVDTAHGIHVGALVERSSFELLGCHEVN